MKARQSNKEPKKQALMTPKEKKAAKHAKKEWTAAALSFEVPMPLRTGTRVIECKLISERSRILLTLYRFERQCYTLVRDSAN